MCTPPTNNRGQFDFGVSSQKIPPFIVPPLSAGHRKHLPQKNCNKLSKHTSTYTYIYNKSSVAFGRKGTDWRKMYSKSKIYGQVSTYCASRLTWHSVGISQDKIEENWAIKYENGKDMTNFFCCCKSI